MRKLFEQELKELLEELEILGRMVDDQWGKTMQALQTDFARQNRHQSPGRNSPSPRSASCAL